MGLDRAFSHLNRGSFTAQDFFADRIDERQAFREALVAVRQRLPVADLVTDLAAPRSNVLVFYGAGGIGKSRLSRELEEAARVRGGRSASVRLDFANGGLRDPEEILLRLRVGLAELGCPFVAFDTLLGIYWQHQHPQQSLSDYLRPRSWSQRIDLAGAVRDSVENLIGDVTDRATFGLVGVGRRLASASVSIIQERARHSRLARDCPRFTDALAASPEELLRYLPYFLAWDLHRAQNTDTNRAETPVVPVVFLDTWEDVHAASTARGSLEDFCALMSYHVPNALFVSPGLSLTPACVLSAAVPMRGLDLWLSQCLNHASTCSACCPTTTQMSTCVALSRSTGNQRYRTISDRSSSARLGDTLITLILPLTFSRICTVGVSRRRPNFSVSRFRSSSVVLCATSMRVIGTCYSPPRSWEASQP
jgi:hypothetical protein